MDDTTESLRPGDRVECILAGLGSGMPDIGERGTVIAANSIETVVDWEALEQLRDPSPSTR